MKRNFENKPAYSTSFEDENGETQFVTAKKIDGVLVVFNEDDEDITDQLDKKILQYITEDYALYINVAKQFYATV